MGGELVVPAATLTAFLLTLARVAGLFVFVPLPGMQTGMEAARIVMALSMTVVLAPYWPHTAAAPSAGLLALWMLAEAALGIGVGLAVAFVTEGIVFAAQALGLQAGYAYASIVNPASQADSSVLGVIAQLAAGLLFFATGMHHEVLRAFAMSLTTVPAGSFTLTREPAIHLMELGQMMFSTGLRLALPAIAVLLMTDISLALLGRVNSQLQLLTLAFPVKMMLALVIFGCVLPLLPRIMRADFNAAMEGARMLLVR